MVERLFLDMRTVLEKRGETLVGALGEIPANDDNGDAGRAEVFLRAGKDQAVLVDVDGTRSDVGRHVGDERHVAGFWAGFRRRSPLRAFDGVVGADMDVGSVR